jgi:lipoprotein-releasing system permease protein
VNVSFFIAQRYLRSKRKSGFVSVIAYMAVGGVVLGVAALIIILSVTNGFAGEVKNRLIGMNAHVSIQRFDGGAIEDYATLIDKVKAFPEVAGAAPVIESKVIIASKRDLSRVDGIPLWGIDPQSFPTVSDLPQHLLYDEGAQIVLGRLPEMKNYGIILGEYLARRLQVGPGFEVLLATVRNIDVEEAVLDGFAPQFWPFLVTDHFESGMYQYDDNYAFIHLEDAQRILELDGAATHIHVRVRDIYQATQVRQALEEELGAYPYRVSDWTQLFPEFFRWIELEKWAIFIALSLIVLVAAFNIMSILVMSVLIKTPEIGILRAMGCTVREIYRIFVYQGLVIGSAGTLVGCLVGLALCLVQQRFAVISIPGDVYLINSLPVDMEALDFLMVAAVSMVICLLTAVYPARKAAALMPVEAIRYIM